jgi:hypothetical protein
MAAPAHSSPAMEAAWQAYHQGVEEVRRLIFDHPFAAGEQERCEAAYLFQQLQAEAFNVAVAPRPDWPRFYPMFEPLAFTWGIPCPDFHYRRLYLDGRRSYRIRGRRSNSLFVHVQAINCHFTLPPERMKLLGDFDLDRFEIGPDGAFEIVVSATKHAGNWIPLDPDSDRNFLVFRECVADWETQVPSEMHVEPIDEVAPRPAVPTEAETIERLEAAVRFMKLSAGVVAIKTVSDAIALAGGTNRFAVPKIDGAAAAASDATYNLMGFELAEDEALVIEVDPPEPRFWDIQVGDVWNQAVDYTYHQSSLNMAQAAPDPDGRLRFVLAHRDPGVANWLDTVGARRGVVLVRWYFASRAATPQARLVRFEELDGHLPPGTARITPEARRAELARRTRAIGRRHDF